MINHIDPFNPILTIILDFIDNFVRFNVDCDILHPTRPFHNLKTSLDSKNMFFAQNEPKIAILGRFSKFSHSKRFLPLDMAIIHVWVMENHSHDP